MTAFIYGAGGLGHELQAELERDGISTLFIDDDEENIYPRMSEAVMKHMNVQNIYIALGDSAEREKAFAKAEKYALKILSYVSEYAMVSNSAYLGRGTLILGNAFIGAHSALLDGTIALTSSVISHQCKVGRFSFICSGAILSGNTNIGHYFTAGVNSSVKQDVVIGSNVELGMSCTVLNDVMSNRVLIGTPSKLHKLISIAQ